MNGHDEDEDSRVLWPVNMTTLATYDGDYDFGKEFSQGREAVIVTELIWDQDDPFAIKIGQYELGSGDWGDPVVVFDIEMLRKILETHAPVGEVGVRLEAHVINQHQSPDPDTMWISITVRPGRADAETCYLPRSCLLGFVKAIYKRHAFEAEPEPQDWDNGLLTLLGGAS